MSINVRVDKDTWIDLVKAPHILISGSTGSGKSYLMKSILCDVLEKNDNVNVIVIDPKSVDYQFLKWRRDETERKRVRFEGDTGEPDVISNAYDEIYGDGKTERDNRRYAEFYWSWKGIELVDRDGIDGGRALKILRLLCNEMDSRYRLMRQYGFSDWEEFVKWLDQEGEDEVLEEMKISDVKGIKGEGSGETEGRAENFKKERIILMVDELTDLMYWDSDKDRGVLRGSVERYLVRLAMLGRAAGIHLVLGTQRPDANVLSGQLRANMPCRICLRVANKTERRIGLGMSGEGQEREMVYLSEYYSIGYNLR